MRWSATILFVDGSERTLSFLEDDTRWYLDECFRKRGVAGLKGHGATTILDFSHISCMVFEAVEEEKP